MEKIKRKLIDNLSEVQYNLINLRERKLINKNKQVKPKLKSLDELIEEKNLLARELSEMKEKAS